MTENTSAPSGALTSQEQIKLESRALRGNISTELADASVPYVSDESYELLKFHGSYQGYDRDTATERKKAGLEKEWEFMLRMKCPGGRLTHDQYLALDAISERYSKAAMRITTRQTFQFHCIVKGDLKPHIAEINAAALSTLGGCGDVVRNVTCSNAPYKNVKYDRIRADAETIARECAPVTGGYHEIWLDGENLAEGTAPEADPLYGATYLPRKFKIALGLPEDNSPDMLTHDLAVVHLYQGDVLLGYNIYAGGGLGTTHNKEETYPRLASPIAFIKPEALIRAVHAVVKIHRDFGDRTNRKHARLKYVVEELGVEKIIELFRGFFGEDFEAPKEGLTFVMPDYLGLHPQGDGLFFLGVPVDSGRIKDLPGRPTRTAFKTAVEKYRPSIVLTADQNILFADLTEADANALAADLKAAGLKLREDVSEVDRWMLACVALPTCGKALAEAERVKEPLTLMMEASMEKFGVKSETISVRVTGCPNGCARPFVGDIGIVGRTPDHYALYIGGDFHGTRLNTKVFDRVPMEHLGLIMDVFFERYAAEKQNGELFGDYAARVGPNLLAKLAEERLLPTYKWAKAA